jgi:hypothetical protein
MLITILLTMLITILITILIKILITILKTMLIIILIIILITILITIGIGDYKIIFTSADDMCHHEHRLGMEHALAVFWQCFNPELMMTLHIALSNSILRICLNLLL